jgi:hypothetical protein
MFVGHFALGFAAKRAVPQLSLAVLFAAAQLADLIWPVLVLAGLEHVRIDPGNTAFTPLDFVSYPYSHSLVMLAIWALVFAAVCQWAVGGRFVFAVTSGLVLSHWLLDFLTHRPDMPLYPGSATVGLGVWNSVVGTLALELAMFAIGVWIYARATRARDAIGRWAFVALTATLAVVYVANLFAGAPPSALAIAVTGTVGGACLLAWSWWADRHREPVR